MTERSYEDAVQVLKRRLGGRWDGLEPDGRAEMASLLRHELHMDAGAADDVITEMIRSGELRYHRGDAVGGSSDVIDDKPRPIAMAPNAPATSGAPGAGFAPAQGYWEIGADQGDVPPGRAGQVNPS